MEIKILFNDLGMSKDLVTGCGWSCLIDNRILFDTGSEGEALYHNADKMGCDLSLVKDIIISHDHWDHTGGLWEMLERNQSLNVWACPGFGDDLKERAKLKGAKLIENSTFMEVSKDIYVTGEIMGEYKGKYMPEQALVINAEQGLNVISGCAHPGIIEFLSFVRRRLSARPFSLVLGGFHLKSKSLRGIEYIVNNFEELGVKKVGPTHCSGAEAKRAFKKKYGDNFIEAKAGQIITV